MLLHPHQWLPASSPHRKVDNKLLGLHLPREEGDCIGIHLDTTVALQRGRNAMEVWKQGRGRDEQSRRTEKVDLNSRKVIT